MATAKVFRLNFGFPPVGQSRDLDLLLLVDWNLRGEPLPSARASILQGPRPIRTSLSEKNRPTKRSLELPNLYPLRRQQPEDIAAIHVGL